MNMNILLQKGITEAERDVLRYLVLGLNNTEIANKLCISVSTVKKHLESVYQKLGTHNRLQTIYVAFIKEDIII